MSQFIYPLAKLTNEITKAYVGVITKKLEHLGIDRGFYALLLIDQHREKLSQNELAALIATDKVCMVRMIDYLSENGFVVRKVNEEDRRAHYITLTEKAKRVIPEIRNTFEKVNEIAMKDVVDDDIWSALKAVHLSLIEMPANEVTVNFKSTKSK